jgi:UDP-N-acetylglucosamine 2-epimerase (hydrolysing)
MDVVLANTIAGLAPVVNDYRPDLLVVHGDRIEALAGAIAGALNNVRVAHIEGGEFSGTIDELLRHAITKLSHLHFVANQSASQIVQQLGEDSSTIFIIGSPEIDIMLSPDLPSIDSVKQHYEVPFAEYAILLFHSVTTEKERLANDISEVVESAKRSGDQFVVIYPNNDAGSDVIFREYEGLVNNRSFRLIPSMRFEAFQTLLKNANYILGNSSSGVREAPVHGTPSINVGSRQSGRASDTLIINVPPDVKSISQAIANTATMKRIPTLSFGDGKAAERFLEALRSTVLWQSPLQKRFHRNC